MLLTWGQEVSFGPDEGKIVNRIFQAGGRY